MAITAAPTAEQLEAELAEAEAEVGIVAEPAEGEAGEEAAPEAGEAAAEAPAEGEKAES